MSRLTLACFIYFAIVTAAAIVLVRMHPQIVGW